LIDNYGLNKPTNENENKFFKEGGLFNSKYSSLKDKLFREHNNTNEINNNSIKSKYKLKK